MALEGRPDGAPTQVFAATIATRELPRFTSAELLSAINRSIETTGVAATLIPAMTTEVQSADPTRIWNRGKVPPRIGLRLNGVVIEVRGDDRPGFGPGETAQLDARSWRDARETIARSRAHVTVGETGARGIGSIDDNFDRAAAVTVVLVAVARLIDAVGAVWQPSHCAVAAKDLPDILAGLAQGRVPTDLWIGSCHDAAQLRGGAAARTVGLTALIGAEIEVAAPHLPGNAGFAMAAELAGAVLRAGELPEPGELLDFGRDAVFAVQRRPGGSRTITLLPSPAAPPVRGRRNAGAA